MILGLACLLIGGLTLVAVWNRCRLAATRPPSSVRLRRRLARGWSVPTLDMMAGLPLPPGFVVRRTASGCDVLANTQHVPHAKELADQFAAWGQERAFEDEDAKTWAILQTCWHFWAKDGDPFRLPLPPGWRLRPGLAHRAHLITGGGCEMRDVSYCEGIASAWHWTWVMMRWRGVLRWTVGLQSVLSGFTMGQGIRLLLGGG